MDRVLPRWQKLKDCGKRSMDGSRPKYDLNFALSGGRHRRETVENLYAGFREAGIDFAVYLPDATLDGIERHIVQKDEIQSYQCVREDEGLAIAMGAYMVGRRPVVLMEGSGIGMSGVILARSLLQRSPMLLVIGHCSSLGERYDYHGTTRLVVEPILKALAVPYLVAMDPSQLRTLVVEGQHTVNGQKCPFAILLPTHVIRE